RWTGPGGIDSPQQAARFWLAARRQLLAEGRPDEGSPDEGRSVLELLPGFPTAWRGGPVEVHRAPILGWRISFAIRWHGYRPALLWDLECDQPEGWAERPPPILTCPGLDPGWRTTEAKGETLLAGTADQLPDAPAPGDSFL
ncbi:MAG: hypothetical protein ACR2QK_17705, partial [Acidimicrobiales bacterium]